MHHAHILPPDSPCDIKGGVYTTEEVLIEIVNNAEYSIESISLVAHQKEIVEYLQSQRKRCAVADVLLLSLDNEAMRLREQEGRGER